jgi:hypothetical protein
MVRAAPATTKMYEYMNDDTDKNWQMHFEKLTVDAGFPELVSMDGQSSLVCRLRTVLM